MQTLALKKKCTSFNGPNNSSSLCHLGISCFFIFIYHLILVFSLLILGTAHFQANMAEINITK